MDLSIIIPGLEELPAAALKQFLAEIKDTNGSQLRSQGMPPEIIKAAIKQIEAQIEKAEGVEFVKIGELSQAEILKVAESDMREQDLAKAKSHFEMAQSRLEMADRELLHMINDRLGLPYDRCGKHVHIDKRGNVIRAMRGLAEKLGLEIIKE
jgi:hypothetical protein